MKRKHNYYSLEREKKNFWQHLGSALASPFKLPGWIASFIFARNITHIALNPSYAPEQSAVHFTKVSNDQNENIVVINFKPKTPQKWFDDILIKFTNTLIALPFITPALRRRLQYNVTQDVKHIDWLLDEMEALLKGTSKQKHCENKSFDWAHIHFKGTEFLDTKMRGYFYQRLLKRFGPEAYETKRSTDIEFYTLKTSDGSELDSVQVNGPGEEQKPLSIRKFIITCIARDQNFISWIKDLNYSASKLGATGISFNYRGVDYSRGLVWTENNMVEDILSQVQRLIALGAQPQNICLDGMCLGGATATLAASRLHEAGLRVKLNNERSFRSLPMLVFGTIVPELQKANWWNPLTYARFALGGVVYVILTPIVWLAGWSVDVESAWNKIPAQDKIYSLARDEQNQLYDGIINDQCSSLASIVDAKIKLIKHKILTNQELSEDEKIILADTAFSPNFKPKNDVLNKPGFLFPHFISRQDLVAELGHSEEYTNHDYFLDRLRDRFNHVEQNKSAPPDSLKATNSRVKPGFGYYVDRPLFIANSADLKSLVKVQSVIQAQKDETLISSYHSIASKQMTFSAEAWLFRLGLWLTSFWILEKVINGAARLVGYPVFPDYNEFLTEISSIMQRENQQPLHRPYLDILLDIYHSGAVYAAYYNTLQKHPKSQDFKTASTYKTKVEENNSQLVTDKIFSLLCNAARQNVPYTRMVLTQGLSISALCDAVNEYNTKFLSQFNQENDKIYPPLVISLYLPEEQSLEYFSYLESLDDLSIEQKNLIEIHSDTLDEAVRVAYFDTNSGFIKMHVPGTKKGASKSSCDTLSAAQLTQQKTTVQPDKKSDETGYSQASLLEDNGLFKKDVNGTPNELNTQLFTYPIARFN